MRFLILSDIHANWEALQAVLADAAGLFDSILCCGDVVGYNPNPAEVIDWTRSNCQAIVRGNHDKVVGGVEPLAWFNEAAKSAALWSKSQLDAEQLEWLSALPAGPVSFEQCTLMHGAPFDEDYYVVTIEDVAECHAYLTTTISFFGHTHLQGAFFFRGRRLGKCPPVLQTERETLIDLERDTTFLVNPGSVGQPRDGDPRAAYALWDVEARTLALRRIAYPIEMTRRKISAAGLPDLLGSRLLQGL